MGKGDLSAQTEKALKAAERLLRFRPRSRRELLMRLKQRFDAATCHDVIHALQEKRLLDDAAFSRFWIQNRMHFRPKGKRALFQELLEKGVAPEVIQETLKELFPEEERAVAERLLASRRKRVDPKDPATHQKLYRFLRSRGFSHDLTSELLERDVQDNDDGE